jgi:hypothetical protein
LQSHSEITLDILGQGELFGELAMADEAAGHAAMALDDGLMCIFSRDDFKKVMETHPLWTGNKPLGVALTPFDLCTKKIVTIQHILSKASFPHWIPAFSRMTCFTMSPSNPSYSRRRARYRYPVRFHTGELRSCKKT